MSDRDSNPARSHDFLPYGRQVIDAADKAAVMAVLESDFLTTGPVVDAFETALADTLKASEVVVCSSGTSALHLAMLAAGIGPDVAVVVPAITFVASANMARMTGAEVIFADVDPVTGLMGVDHICAAAARAKKPVAAILPVHLNGNCGDYQALIDYAAGENWWLITDGCHALGSLYDTADGPKTALVGQDQPYDKVITCFSFHPVKTIAMGEGGAVACGTSDYAAKMRSLRHHGLSKTGFTGTLVDDYGAPWYHEFQANGFNYRASDIHCALGLSQLAKLPDFIAARQAAMAQYKRALADVEGVTLVADHCSGAPVWHLMAAHFNWQALGLTRLEFVTALKARGIGSQVHYIPLYRQPTYADIYDQDGLIYSGAEAYYATVLSLPLYASMTLEDVDRVVSAIKDILKA